MIELIYSVGAFLLVIILHGLSSFAFPSLGSVARAIAGASVVGVVFLIYMILGECQSSDIIPAIILFAFLCELYIFTITLTFASISANILADISESKVLELGLSKVLDKVDTTLVRVDRLMNKGLAERIRSHIAITEKGSYIVAGFNWLRSIFHPEYIKNKPNLNLYSICLAVVMSLSLLFPLIGILSYSGTTLSIVEEPIGYRYFYGIRILLGGEAPWLPQGHTLGLLQHIIQIFLPFSWIGDENFALRAQLFVILNNITVAIIAGFFTYKLSLQINNKVTSAVIIGLFYVLINSNEAEQLWYLYPDYPMVTLLCALVTLYWSVQILTKNVGSQKGWSILLGIFFGVAGANKITNIVYPLAIAMLIIVYNRPIRPLRWLSVTFLSGFVTFCVINFLFYKQLLLIKYIEGLWLFVLSQSTSGLPTKDGFFSSLIPAEVGSYMFMGPLFVCSALILSVINIKFRVLLSFVPGLVLLLYFLYARNYSWTAIEVLLYIWVCFSLGIIVICGLNHSTGYAFLVLIIPFATVAILKVSSYVTTQSKNVSLYSVAESSLRSSIVGQSSLFLVPGNNYRIQSIYSSLCKGGTDIFLPVWGVSNYITKTFPNFACAVVPYGLPIIDRYVEQYDKVIFLKMGGESISTAIDRVNDYFKIDINQTFKCNNTIKAATTYFVICNNSQRAH